MRRVHLFELEDQPWFPRAIRDGMTDSLAMLHRTIRTGKHIAPLISRLLRTSGGETLVDLCSGGGGPLNALAAELRALGHTGLRVVMTDKYPNRETLQNLVRTGPPGLEFREDAVDATDVPEDLGGVRTLFLAFHHFRPEQARRILEDAFHKRQPIAIVEATERSVATFVGTLFGPLVQMGAAPFLKPFRWSRILGTYALPIIPFGVFFDGVVSMLRTYSPAELEQLIQGLDAPDWKWEIGRTKVEGVPLAYFLWLVGHPVK